MEKLRYNLGKSGGIYGSLLFPVPQWRCSSDIWWILLKFCCPPDDTFVLLDGGVMSEPPPVPPVPSPLSSSLPPPPAQLLGPSQRSWTVIDAIGSPQRPGPEQAVSPSTPGWGKLNRTCVKKSLQREKEPCAAHLPDKRFNQPGLRHPSPSSSPWDELKSATTITWWKYPLTKRDGSSQRGWAVIEFDAVLITTHVRRPCGVLVAGTTCSHLLPSTLEDI